MLAHEDKELSALRRRGSPGYAGVGHAKMSTSSRLIHSSIPAPITSIRGAGPGRTIPAQVLGATPVASWRHIR
jgi:hypothetical protein